MSYSQSYFRFIFLRHFRYRIGIESWFSGPKSFAQKSKRTFPFPPVRKLLPVVNHFPSGYFRFRFFAELQPYCKCERRTMVAYFDDHRMRLVSFSGKAPFCWSEGRSLGVCVIESICSLDVDSWIEAAWISLAPSRTDAGSQFATISSYSSISISASSLTPAISPCSRKWASGFLTQLLERHLSQKCGGLLCVDSSLS